MMCANCGNKTKKATFVRGYDLTIWAGLPAKARRMRVLRCSTCGANSVEGRDLEAALDALVLEVVQRRERLTGKEARFLRGRLQLTQKALAKRMGVNPITISDWERGDRHISSEHDFMLRALSLPRLPKNWVVRALGLLSVHKEPPPKIRALEADFSLVIEDQKRRGLVRARKG